MANLPPLSKRDLKRLLTAFAKEFENSGDLFTGLNRHGKPFTIHYPHPQKPWPPLVSKWLSYLDVSHDEFEKWWNGGK